MTSILNDSNALVHWIDTTGDFLAERAQATISSLLKERNDSDVNSLITGNSK